MNNSKNDFFYMIYVENGKAPTVKHSTYKEAVTEAKRLARKTKKKVFILSTYKSFQLKEFEEIIYINLEVNNGKQN